MIEEFIKEEFVSIFELQSQIPLDYIFEKRGIYRIAKNLNNLKEIDKINDSINSSILIYDHKNKNLLGNEKSFYLDIKDINTNIPYFVSFKQDINIEKILEKLKEKEIKKIANYFHILNIFNKYFVNNLDKNKDEFFLQLILNNFVELTFVFDSIKTNLINLINYFNSKYKGITDSELKALLKNNNNNTFFNF